MSANYTVRVELLEKPMHARLLEPVVVEVREHIITVPVGYETDFASVPQLFWNIVPPVGKYTIAAVVHDYLYDAKLFTKAETDSIFYDLMRKRGVGKFTAGILYAAVRTFGFMAWRSA